MRSCCFCYFLTVSSWQPWTISSGYFCFAEVEKEYEETERRLQQLSDELVSLNCEMMIHLQVKRESRVTMSSQRRLSASFRWSRTSPIISAPAPLRPAGLQLQPANVCRELRSRPATAGGTWRINGETRPEAKRGRRQLVTRKKRECSVRFFFLNAMLCTV